MLETSTIGTIPHHDGYELLLTIFNPSSDRVNCTRGAHKGIDMPALTNIRKYIHVPYFVWFHPC